jgi:hypothetical protein
VLKIGSCWCEFLVGERAPTMDNPSSRNILIKFKEAPDYKKVGATGIYGGMTPTGQVLCHFFIDFAQIPEEVTHIVQEDGQLVPESGPTTASIIIRELQVGILLPPNVLRAIGEWFIAQSNTIEQIAQGNNPG